MASSTSAITAPTFNGSSTYSSSFQQVLTNAVNLASLPMQQTQSDVDTLTNEQSALGSLESTFQSLDTALQAIGTASGGSTSATVSDPSAISASTSSGALPGTYSIEVDSIGSYTTAMSPAGSTTVTDPTSQSISSASSFTLTVNGANTTITPSDGSLEGLADAINSSAAGVQATIVNLGSNTSPDYRLVVTSTSWNADTVQLSDGSTSNLLSTISTGSPATYSVNGSTTQLQSNSPQVTLAPGLTVTLLGASTQPDTVTVAADYSGLQTALSNFATAYNAAFSAVEAQVGQNGGALSGQSIVYTLQNMLESLVQYSSGSGAVASLNDLGLSVDDTGVMTFDASTFTGQDPSAIAAFLGSATTGGFMETATNAMTAVDDPTAGDLATDYSGLEDQITNDNQMISDDQARITLMETNLQSELTQADAAIATLQSQKTYFADLFQAEYPSTS
jgi:flagellar hook-associated protein 2